MTNRDFILRVHIRIAIFLALFCTLLNSGSSFAETPPPMLDGIFPAGAVVGQTTVVDVSGRNLQKLQTLLCNIPGAEIKKIDPAHCSITIPAKTPPGFYDLWAVCENGVSSPRTFWVGNRPELLEKEPNDALTTPQTVSTGSTINGRIEKAGDVDYYRFEAKQGQRVILECWAERIDSRLRAVLEVYDSEGKRLAANRGYFGIDPLIDFQAPANGQYTVKVQDLVSAGSAEYFYRLDIDSGPRVAFTVPSVIQRGKTARVRLFGWNLTNSSSPRSTPASAPSSNSVRVPGGEFDSVEVDISPAIAQDTWPLPIRLQPSQAAFEGFAYHLPGSHASVALGLTDVPVVSDRMDNHAPASAQAIAYPCEVSGQLTAGDECDWFAIQANRGEVLYLEAWGQRIQSPVDLQVSILDATGERELVQFTDEVKSVGGLTLPTDHLDPAGRWVVPADGRYLIAIRNLMGGLRADSRRTYRLSVRREEPDYQLIAIPRREGVVGLTVNRGGNEVLDVLALRRRGMNGAIRISAKNLPEGIECPDVWLGPEVDRTTLVVSATRDSSGFRGELKLEGSSELAGKRAVRGGTLVRLGTPNGWGRLMSQIPVAVSEELPVKITADAHETITHQLYGKLQVRHSPGGILDVAVHVERNHPDFSAPVKLSVLGLPETIRNQVATIPAGEQKGYVSLYLPPTLPVGKYSIVIRAETTVPTANKKTETVVVYSNSVTIDVQPAAFITEVDPFAPKRAKRGDVIQVGYSAKRRNGFIGKIHTELAAPGKVTDVDGLRGRGETFTGQTDKGTLQIIINKDAPLGEQMFLRFLSVGVLEDEPIFFGASFLPLEIVDSEPVVPEKK